MPALTSRRFPSWNAGKSRDWLLPESVLPKETRERYQGGDAEERRLFYVAMTRARDRLYLSHFRKIYRTAEASPYLAQLFSDIPSLDSLPLPASPAISKTNESSKVELSFSELSDFEECGYRYRLSSSLGFETQLVSELGYGRAIQHILRFIAEIARTKGNIPTVSEVQKILDREFYLPYANSNNFDNMRATADRLIGKYLTTYKDDLTRIWVTERPFEIHLPTGTLSGRADVILDHHEGKPDSLAIVDYKTAKDHDQDAAFAFQLTIYAAAGQGEGLKIDAALLHHLDISTRTSIDIGPTKIATAVTRVQNLMGELAKSNYTPKPEKKKCAACDFRKLCRHAPADPRDYP